MIFWYFGGTERMGQENRSLSSDFSAWYQWLGMDDLRCSHRINAGSNWRKTCQFFTRMASCSFSRIWSNEKKAGWEWNCAWVLGQNSPFPWWFRGTRAENLMTSWFQAVNLGRTRKLPAHSEKHDVFTWLYHVCSPKTARYRFWGLKLELPLTFGSLEVPFLEYLFEAC